MIMMTDAPPQVREHGYICQHCGERHVSDDTELWCAIAKQQKAAEANNQEDTDV